MSAQGAKKRLGSRRQVKKKSPEVDEFHTMETTVEEHSVSTEGAEDVPEFSNNRRKLGSSRKNKRPHPGKDLGVSDRATKNTTEDDPLDTSQVPSTEEVKVALQVPEESHRCSELKNPRREKDKNSATLTHNESLQDSSLVSESHVIAEDAELRTETQPDKELEVNLSQSGGTFDLTEVCDKELNTKHVEAEESQRKGGLEEVTELLSQSNQEHREAESSGTGTEETAETTPWFVATVEKESELTYEDEIVMSEPPESFLSGSPSEVQNLSTSHPEPDPEPSIPKSANLPEDLHERGADSKVELSDNSEEDDGELHKPGPEVKGLGSLETVAKVNTEDQRESAEMHDVLSESVSRDAAPDSSPRLQHVPLTKTDQSESSDDADEPQNTAVGQDYEADGQIDDVKFTSDQLHEEHKDLLSETEQSCSSQVLQSERDSCWDPQPQESAACFTLIEHRRKLGSSRRHRGGQRAVDSESEPLSQSNQEHREAESSGTGTEETAETTPWFVATVEKESELMCEDEIVVSEPPESFLSGSPSEVQNLSTSHPEPDPEPSIPKSANFPEDLHERGADSKVELSDNSEEDDGELHKPGPEVKGLGSLETVAKVNTEHQRVSTEMHNVLPESVSRDAAPDSSPHLQHVPLTKTDQSESSDRRNDAVGQIDDVEFTSDQLHEEHKDLLSEIEQSCSSQVLQSERDSCWDPQPQESAACFTLIEHRRKLGSSRRHRGGQRAVDSESEPLSQSNQEHREAESSGTGTEETAETTPWFVATVEKESELMCEDEIVVSEPPESFLSGSPSEVQNLSTSHPEPDPEPSIPKSANLPEDLHERGVDSKEELSDNDEEAMMLMQQMNEMSSNEGELSVKTQSEAGLLLDCDLQEDVELITASTAMMAKVSNEIRDHQPAQKMNPAVSEGKSFQEDTDLSQNMKDKNKTAMTGSESDIWRTAYHSRAATGSVTLESFTIEAPHVVQKDQDSPQHNHAQHTNDAKETVGDPGGEGSVEGQQKLVQSSDTLTQEEDQERSSSSEPTNAELTSSDPSSPLCFQETISADPAMEVPGEREPGGHLDDSLHFQERSKQRRRKMGSTRWTHKNPEGEQVHRAEVTESSNSVQAGGESVERPAEVSQEKNTETSVKLLQDEANVTSDPQSTHSNLISHTDSAACDAGRSAADSEEGVNPTIIVEGSDLWDGGSNVDVNMEPSHIDDFTAPEAHITSCLIKPSQSSPPPSFQSTQDVQESLDCVTEKQEQPLQSAEESTVESETVKSELEADKEHNDLQDPDKVAEEGYIKNLEPANGGPDLNMANSRGTMDSTCSSLSSHRKEEDLHHPQKVDNETADKRREGSFSEHRKGPVKGTHLPEPAPLQTSEEAPTASVSDCQPTTSPENDVMSDTLSSRRRRKLGSHRKSSRPRSQETQPGSDVGSIAEEHTVKTDEENKNSEVDDSEKNSTNTSSSEAGGHVNPVSSNSDLSFAPRTVVHPLFPGSCLSPENQALSFARNPGAEDVKSNSYSVIMVGNSNVGKTSFMRRVLNGRFSSDLPSSVGLDMCLWPVTVDGKRVVLQLWDTAGQERFHSVTRQIFHKAHAFLLMYDITSSRSFTAVSYWANCIQEGANENVTILLLGNKSDCAERQVPTQEGEILAKEYAFGFMECSAATGQNVNESLETVARILSNKVKLGEETTVLHKEPRQKKSSGCC